MEAYIQSRCRICQERIGFSHHTGGAGSYKHSSLEECVSNLAYALADLKEKLQIDE